MNRERGFRVQATVKCIKGTCNAGHKVGDVMDVSARNTAGMCGYLYHASHPAILMLQFGGSLPWGAPDTVELQCPDPENVLTLELKRKPAEKEPSDPAGAEPTCEPPVRLGRVVCKIEEI
jgi:uncharacterized repeat protein (TIGR04076 family)